MESRKGGAIEVSLKSAEVVCAASNCGKRLLRETSVESMELMEASLKK